MEYAIGHIMRHYAKDRDIVVWGTGENAASLKGKIEKYRSISFFVSGDHEAKPTFSGRPVYGYETLSPTKHYVIVLAGTQFKEIREALAELGFNHLVDYFDWIKCHGLDGLPIDVEYNDIFIGKKSYFPMHIHFFVYIKSIGKFTSINSSVQVMPSHPTNMITTAPMLGILSEAKREIYALAANHDQRQTGMRVKIGNDVWIGANVFINTTSVAEIGDGAIIGAGAVVLEDVPPYAVVVGVPARIVKYRYTPEQIEILQRVKWWEWDNDTIERNAELLIYPERFFERFANVNHKEVLP